VVLGVDLARVEDFTVICGLDTKGRQVHFDRFNTMGWGRQYEVIMAAIKKFPGCVVVVDSTGPGDPAFDELSSRYPLVEGVHFTHQNKRHMVYNLALLLESNKLELANVPVQTSELVAYEYVLTRKTRQVTTSAPVGMHDDTVMALALAATKLQPGTGGNNLDDAMVLL